MVRRIKVLLVYGTGTNSVREAQNSKRARKLRSFIGHMMIFDWIINLMLITLKVVFWGRN